MKHRWIALVFAFGFGVGVAACAPPGGAPGSSADASGAAEPSEMEHSIAPGESMSPLASGEESEEEYEY